ncbi:MAG: hypothetical protein ACJ76Y_30130 [Thermoanaerobaculia bacterium]
MKRLLLFAAVLATALFLPTPKAEAVRTRCFEENYGGQCGTTCVQYNDQGSVDQYITVLHSC